MKFFVAFLLWGFFIFSIGVAVGTNVYAKRSVYDVLIAKGAIELLASGNVIVKDETFLDIVKVFNKDNEWIIATNQKLNINITKPEIER